MEPTFRYENGHAICETRDSMGRIYKGEAWCAPEDADVESALVGENIAEMRAQIAAAKTYRDDLKIKISALKQLYYNMKHSTHFNPKSYEAIMLYKQIKLHEEDLEIAKHQLAVLKLDLYEFLRDKEEFYQKLRKHRKNEATGDSNS